jgi:D-lactate dehydrogenase (cytochrome)
MQLKPTIQTNVMTDYPDYLRDESRKAGQADTISFPTSEDDVCRILRQFHAGGVAVTTQGGRTGITGGAVPEGGHILNLSRMTRVLGLRHDEAAGTFQVIVQPGLSLADARTMLRHKEFDTTDWSAESLAALEQLRQSGAYFLPLDPTETSASIGGMVACNASGACSFHYGPTRRYVAAVRVALAHGVMLEVRRGRERASGRAFRLKAENGRVIEGRLPSYAMPAVKNASGFFAADDMDLVDLFVGAEGTLGVMTQIELTVLPEPPARWGVTAFFPSEAAAVTFVKTVRAQPEAALPVAVEFFDRRALDLLRGQKAANPAFAEIPPMPAAWHTAVYVEYHGAEDAVMEAVEAMSALMTAAGGADDATWIATGEAELERLKYFRHAVPEAVNLLIDERRRQTPGLTKLGTDMAVPGPCLDEVLAMYHAGLEGAGLDHVIFGHIGNNHLHVNILPRTMQDYAAGKDLYLQWARRVIAMGGTVSAEHGIGKFKVALLREMFGDQGVYEMREVKRAFDPEGILNRGNLF